MKVYNVMFRSRFDVDYPCSQCGEWVRWGSIYSYEDACVWVMELIEHNGDALDFRIEEWKEINHD